MNRRACLRVHGQIAGGRALREFSCCCGIIECHPDNPTACARRARNGGNLPACRQLSGTRSPDYMADLSGVYVAGLHREYHVYGIPNVDSADGALTDLLSMLDEISATVIVVTNEVGSGVSPTTRLGNAYADVLGALNRRVAERSDRAYLLVSGMAVRLK